MSPDTRTNSKVFRSSGRGGLTRVPPLGFRTLGRIQQRVLPLGLRTSAKGDQARVLPLGFRTSEKVQRRVLPLGFRTSAKVRRRVLPLASARLGRGYAFSCHCKELAPSRSAILKARTVHAASWSECFHDRAAHKLSQYVGRVFCTHDLLKETTAIVLPFLRD